MDTTVTHELPDLAVLVVANICPNLATGCWEWSGKRSNTDYGTLSVRVGKETKYIQAHRLTYTIFVGKIPVGYQIDHLCNNHCCCNPRHLEPALPVNNHKRLYHRTTPPSLDVSVPDVVANELPTRGPRWSDNPHRYQETLQYPAPDDDLF